jgi:hypothetical protein
MHNGDDSGDDDDDDDDDDDAFLAECPSASGTRITRLSILVTKTWSFKLTRRSIRIVTTVTDGVLPIFSASLDLLRFDDGEQLHWPFC